MTTFDWIVLGGAAGIGAGAVVFAKFLDWRLGKELEREEKDRRGKDTDLV